MGLSLYLPEKSQTVITLHIPVSEEGSTVNKLVNIDAFELEDMLMAAKTKADQQSTEWWDEFPAMLIKRFPDEQVPRLNKGQLLLLNSGLRTHIAELKKKLFQSFDDSTGSESSQQQQTDEKQESS